MDDELVDWTVFNGAREQLGAGFARILQYFREDGVKSVETIEAAIRQRDSVALVRPAHTLKGESLQFGANALSALAEKIELTARHLVEVQETPEELVPDAARLRPLFTQTLDQLEKAINPLVARRSSFGQKDVANQPFGRI